MELKKNSGGRPKKDNPRSEQLAVMCTKAERKIIEDKAKLLQVSMSQYLREIGLSGKIDVRLKTIPKELLELKATLNHLAANANQLAKKRNQGSDLNHFEKASVTTLSTRIKEVLESLKIFLQ